MLHFLWHANDWLLLSCEIFFPTEIEIKCLLLTMRLFKNLRELSPSFLSLSFVKGAISSLFLHSEGVKNEQKIPISRCSQNRIIQLFLPPSLTTLRCFPFWPGDVLAWSKIQMTREIYDIFCLFKAWWHRHLHSLDGRIFRPWHRQKKADHLIGKNSEIPRPPPKIFCILFITLFRLPKAFCGKKFVAIFKEACVWWLDSQVLGKRLNNPLKMPL